MILPSLNDYILTDPTLAKTFLQLCTLYFPIIITLYLTVAVLQNFFLHYAKEGHISLPHSTPVSWWVNHLFLPQWKTFLGTIVTHVFLALTAVLLWKVQVIVK